MKDLLSIVGLSGNIFMSYNKDEDYIHIGPETDDGWLSDSIYIDDYIAKKAKELNIKMDVGCAENCHQLLDKKKKWKKQFKKLKKAIEKDGYKTVNKNDL